MMEVLKCKIESSFDVWSKEIEAAPDKCYKIDITEVFEHIFAHNIITIAFGEDISDNKFTLLARKTKNGSDFE